MTSLTSALLTYAQEGELIFETKPWGVMHEVHVPRRDLLIKQITVNAGHQTSKQFHQEKDELIIILGGSGHVLINDEPHYAPPLIRILPGTVHRVVGPLTYLELSTYHPNDVVRLEDDYGR